MITQDSLVGVRLVGVLIDGPPPLSRNWIELTPEILVLYGLNGAGKTSLLRGLASAFTGARGGGVVQLHIEVVPQLMHKKMPLYRMRTREKAKMVSSGKDSKEEILLHEVFLALRQGLRETTEAGRWALPQEVPTLPISSLADLIAEYVWTAWMINSAEYGLSDEATDEEIDHLAKEIISQGRFVLSPTGENDSPSWLVQVAAMPLGETPLLLESYRADPENWFKTSSDNLNRPLVEWQNHGYSMSQQESGYQAHTEAPGWAARPLTDLSGEVKHDAFLRNHVVQEIPTSLENTTLAILKLGGESLFVNATHDSVEWSAYVRTTREQLQKMANALSSSFLLDYAPLECALRHPKDWLTDGPVGWVALDVTGVTVPLGELSKAQERWARFAVQFGFFLINSTNAPKEEELTLSALRIGLIDEPEQALHVAAQHHLLRGLRSIAMGFGMPLVVTTHLPVFLSDPDVRLLHVYRDETGHTQSELMTTPLEQTAERLGLHPPDLLQMHRVMILVEGEHDNAVLETLLSSELERARAHVLKLRGTHHLMSLVDAQFLHKFSDAHLVVVVDRLHRDIVDSWEKAKRFAKSGDVSAGLKELRRLNRKQISKESRAVIEFAEGILSNGFSHRLHFHPLKEPDVIYYLPAQALVPGETWTSLKRQWDGRNSIKKWIAENKGVHITTENVRKAAEQIDHVPDDFVAL